MRSKCLSAIGPTVSVHAAERTTEQLAVNASRGASGQFKRGHRHDYAYPKVHRNGLQSWLLASRAGMLVFRHFDEDGTPHQVGNKYVSKMELLSNLEGYAAEFGCDGAAKKESAPVLLTALQHCSSMQIAIPRRCERLAGSRRARQGCEVSRSGWQAAPLFTRHWSLGRLNPRSATSAGAHPPYLTKNQNGNRLHRPGGYPIPEQRRLSARLST